MNIGTSRVLCDACEITISIKIRAYDAISHVSRPYLLYRVKRRGAQINATTLTLPQGCTT